MLLLVANAEQESPLRASAYLLQLAAMLFVCVGDGMAAVDDEELLLATEPDDTVEEDVNTVDVVGVYVGCGCHMQYRKFGLKVQCEEPVLRPGFHDCS